MRENELFFSFFTNDYGVQYGEVEREIGMLCKNIAVLAGMLACTLAAAACASDTLSYGICAHLTRSECSPRLLKGNIDSMRVLGVGCVRCDFDPYSVPVRNGVRDYSRYDAILDRLDEAGIRMHPILRGYDQDGGGERTSDLVAYSNYVTEVVGHFGGRMPVWEVFNEANLSGFFPGADPVRYASVLRTAYGAIKAVDPSIRVAFTEIGWPTHVQRIQHSHILTAGLKLARPEQKSWRVLTFEQGEPVFCNLYGLRIEPRRIGDKDYQLPITGDPVYFHGAALAKIGSIK